jgi:toxin ParE1/3/4
VIDRIEARLTLLAENPRLGAEYQSHRPGLRSFSLPPYQIFYQRIPDGIRLVRVLHGARDTGIALRED